VESFPRPLSRNLIIPRCFLFGALFWIGSCAALLAAPERSDDYVMREWHTSDGLLSDQIGRAYQDPAGYLWVATVGGLMRFDGAHFEEYPLNPGGPAYSRMMVSTSALGLLVAPWSRRGLMALRGNVFQPWHPEEFSERVVTGLFPEPGGALWISCDDGAVFRHDGGVLKRFEASDGLPRARNRWFASDAQGRVWVVSTGSVTRYQEGKFVPLEGSFGDSELRIGSSTRGGPWLITRDHLMRVTDNRAVEVSELPVLLGAHYVQAIQEGRDGMLWVGTRSQGLHVLANNTLQQVKTSHEDIFTLCEDRDGAMWVGTNGGGLDRIRRKTYLLYDKSAGLLDNQTYTVCADRNGDMWFANRDGGAVRVHDGKLETLATRAGWPRLSLISIFPLGGGQMGVSTGSGNFAFASDGPLNLRPLAGPPTVPAIRATYAARNGDVWMSVDPDRVGRLRDGKFQTFGSAEGMTGHQVRGLAEDSAGRIWVGAAEGKLFCSNGPRFEQISLGGVQAGSIQAIRVEDDGTTWLGTVTGGIVVLANGQVRSCTDKFGLPDSNITEIQADRDGFLWFGSKRGIFRISRQEILDWVNGKIPRVTPLVIGQDEGLKDLSCQGVFQPAAGQSPDGKLWFVTQRGVLSIDPSIQLAAPTPPPVAIEEIRCDEQRVPLTRPFTVASSVRKLEIRFGVLNLSAPDRVLAKYRLDGFDDDWVIAPPNRVAAYPRLPPGKYRFLVMASGGDGAVNEKGDTILFTVEPHWWQTWWFRIGSAILVVLAVALAVQAWSHRRLREKLGKLERERAVEHERRRIAQNIHDDLGASLTRISLLTQQARHENTSGAGYYDQIHTTATDITRSMDEIVWAVNPNYDDLESLAGYLGDFAQSFLSVAGIRCRLDVPDHLPTMALSSQIRHHVFLSCKEALNNVVKHAGADEVTISIAIHGKNLLIAIKDNGRGHPVTVGGTIGDAASPVRATVTRVDRRATTGSGLKNLRRRMADIGGTCEIASEEGQGTTVTFTIPFLSSPR
jgi:signal transduction histidine kinase/ligand-binding sensor domain-containing protein